MIVERYEKLRHLAKLVQQVDGDFNMFLRYVDADESLTFVTATEMVHAWSTVRNEMAGKEISIIYG